jgi:hypothetical protein
MDGRPASFSYEDGQICYAGSKDYKVRLVDSLKQVKLEQKKSIKFRKEHNYDIPNYSYALVGDNKR